MSVPDYLIPLLIGIAEIAAAGLLIWGGIRLIDRLLPGDGGKDEHHHRFKRQLIKMLVAAAGLLLLVIVLPVSDTTRGQLLSLLGLVLTAMIALGSTSFVSNAMAGIMLRSVNNFRPGDFIRIGEHAGRVSERGLFHTEIQTEERDLTTLPNLYLVQQPVTVVRSSGTFVSAGVSLGYDVPHETAKSKLLEATERAGLEEGVVRISDLLDHSVQYRVYGFLTDTKKILLTRSRLREEILNVLHEADIEVTSPTHMYQRRLDDESQAIPERVLKGPETKGEEVSKEELIFDKAAQAEKTETLRERRDELKRELQAQQKNGGDKAAAEKLQKNIDRLDRLIEQRAAQKKEGR